MLTLELNPETEKKIRRAAEKANKPIEAYVEDVFAMLPAENEETPKPARTGAELMQAIEALNLSGEYGDMSMTAEEYARKLREESNRPRYA